MEPKAAPISIPRLREVASSPEVIPASTSGIRESREAVFGARNNGSLTSFNVLFADDDDQFKGASSE